MTRHRTLLATIAAVLLSALFAGQAHATRLVFQETVIEGEVRKPEVTVFISRENLDDRYQLQLEASFLPKIIESVEHAPF